MSLALVKNKQTKKTKNFGNPSELYSYLLAHIIYLFKCTLKHK